MNPTPDVQVLVNGDDVYEDLLGVSATLAQLASEAGLSATRGMGMWRFDRPSHPGEPKVYVLYTATGNFTGSQQCGLRDRVRSGAGLFALHASNVLGAGKDAGGRDRVACQLIGSRYVSHGPQPHRSRFMVNFCRSHEITNGLADFEIEHEHYVVEVYDDVEVLALRQTAQGPEPLLHVRQEGQGRACYLQLGHDMLTWEVPTARELARRALRWCAGL